MFHFKRYVKNRKQQNQKKKFSVSTHAPPAQFNLTPFQRTLAQFCEKNKIFDGVNDIPKIKTKSRLCLYDPSTSQRKSEFSPKKFLLTQQDEQSLEILAAANHSDSMVASIEQHDKNPDRL